jgi:glycosyltransferase involved in cell wall biosynthesis
MTWMILICHLPERAEKLRRLTRALDRQIKKHNGTVNYKINDAGRSMPTGIKRNMLIEQTQSDYINFIDDDDEISENYIDEIVKGMETGADVITFNGWYTEFGKNRRDFTIRLGSGYYEDPKDEFYYHRFPNHLCPVKRSAVKSVNFPPVWQAEDYQWALKVKEKNLLKTEYHIPEFLYWYDCNPVVRRRMRA